MYLKLRLFILSSFFICSVQAQMISELLDKHRFGRTDQQISFNDGDKSTYLPVTVIKGKFKGPTFTIIAGIHGFEYPPIVAVQKILQSIVPEQLNGSLIVVPIANIASFYGRTPFVNPLDGKNLNNSFPGKANGSLTEQIAHWISTEIIPFTDVFLDIHAGDASEDLSPFICYYNNQSFPKQTKMSQELAEQSGFSQIVSYPYTLKSTEPAKYAFKQAVQAGKTGISIEAGKLGHVQDDQVKKIIDAVYRMLNHLKMYSYAISDEKQNKTYLNEQTYIKAAATGIFISKLKSGDSVVKGEVIGHISNEFGEIQQTLTSPVNGMILYKIGTPPVNITETVFCIGYQ